MKNKAVWMAAIGILAAAAIAGYSLFSYKRTVRNLKATDTSLLAETADLQTTLHDLTDRVTKLETETSALTGALLAQQQQSTSVVTSLGQVSSTVDTLQKLSTTDPELLEKYSKVYFLNENYVPASLTDIDPKYVYTPGKALQFLTPALPFLDDLIDAANATGLHLQLASAYRSFGTQSELKSSYDFTYGAGTANSFSAEQGYSEHQLGTAVDFTADSINGTLDGFDQTPEYAWLTNNAYKYGFELSYPEGNGYYEFEPWHWRFVGIALATYLHDNNLHFYDVDQRVINTYLADIFNNQ